MSRSRMFGDQHPEAPSEDGVPSPRTTIVGGRPPESGAELPPIPTGIQQLLRLAAVDPGFREKLIERRGAVAEAAEVPLTSSERAVLQAAPAEQLDLMIEHVPPVPPDRREFLRGVAAGAVTLLGGAAFDVAGPGGCGERAPYSRPQPPEPKAGAASRPARREMESEGGAAPHLPEGSPNRPEDREMVSGGGAAPSLPPRRPEHRLEAPGGAAPDVPPVPAGIRPDVPPPTRGIQPDVPPPKKKKKPKQEPKEEK